MSALLFLFACLLLGVIAARYAQPPLGLAQALNWWVIDIALPALVLQLVPRLRFDWHLWFLVVSQWFVFLGAWALFATLGKARRWSRGRVGALVLVCGLGNTAFMGYPMIEALRGAQGLALAVIADQLGAFVALAVGGVLVAAVYSGQQPAPGEIVRRVLFFPAFVALLAGVAVGALGSWPPVLDEVLGRLSATLTPLALFSVGLRFRMHPERGQLGVLALGLGWKLVAAPLSALLLGRAAGVGGLTLTIGTLQAAMAPMISAAILADQNHLEPRLANNALGAGILLSLASVPLWNRALGG